MTTIVSEATEQAAEEVRNWLAHEWSTDLLHPADAEYRIDEDSEGNDAVYFTVTIPVPENMDTWPRDDMIRLRHDIRGHKAHGKLPRVYLILRPEHDDPQPGDEEDEPVAATG